MAVLEDRLAQTIGLLEQLKSAGQGVCTSLWLDELAPVDVPLLATRLLQALVHIAQWKESSAWAGAGMTLALVQGYFLSSKRLTSVKKGLPLDDEGKQIEVDEHLPKLQYAASRVATFVDLDDFMEETVEDPEVDEEDDDESDEL